MREKKGNDRTSVRKPTKPARKSGGNKSPFEKFYREKDKGKSEDNSDPKKSRRGSPSPNFESKKSFGFDRRSSSSDFEKKPFDRERKNDSDFKNRGEKRTYDKPAFKKDDRTFGTDRPSRSRSSNSDFEPKKTFGSERRSSSSGFEKKPFDRERKNDSDFKGGGEKRTFDRPAFKKDDRSFDKDRPRKTYGREEDNKREFKPGNTDRTFEKRTTRTFGRSNDFDKKRNSEFDIKPFVKKEGYTENRRTTNFESRGETRFSKDRFENKDGSEPKPFTKRFDAGTRYDRDDRNRDFKPETKKLESDEYQALKKQVFEEKKPEEFVEKRKSIRDLVDASGSLWLNKFVAQAGICSRRKAAELIKDGDIFVNGIKESNPGYEVKPDDVITYKGNVLKKEEKLVYLLMNKPKNVITTSEDDKGRRTVLDLVKEDYAQRLFPVGRLDRNTTGLLLLTNDGDLTKKLSHPSHQIKKVYQVWLYKNVSLSDLEKIREGVVLEDGVAKVDSVDYIDGGKKNEIGIEIHSGKNRIVRRIFESLGYEVEKLDRTLFAGLTKKDLPRGYYRELLDKEVIMLKHFTNMRKD